MEILVVLAIVVVVPIALLAWTRRSRAQGADADPQGHRDLGRGGVPGHGRDDTWGSGGSL